VTGAPALLAAALASAAVLILAVGGAPALLLPARRPGPTRPGRWSPRGRWSDRWPHRHRPAEPDELGVAAWCERVAGGVRSGHSLTRSIVEAGSDPGAPFEHVAHAVQRGRSLGDALGADPGDPASPRGLAEPVVEACAQVGGPAAIALERVAAVLAARAAERAERRTASAQAPLSAQVLTVIPHGVLGVLVSTEPSIRAAIATPAGTACVLVGALLDVVGWGWMQRMIGATA
jgi:tight adherence protein B